MGILSTQRNWLARPARAFEQDGTALGIVVLETSQDLKVKQTVVLKSDTQPNLKAQISKIIDRKTIMVGPHCEKDLNVPLDVSAYLVADNATIEAPEQPRPNIPIDKNQLDRFEHEEEPIMAKRVTLVSKDGGLVDPRTGTLLAGIEWDDVVVTYPDGKTEVYTFSFEGALVVTVTLEYRTAEKEDLVHAFKELP